MESFVRPLNFYIRVHFNERILYIRKSKTHRTWVYVKTCIRGCTFITHTLAYNIKVPKCEISDRLDFHDFI
jgi:hypothetical protein